MNKPTMPTPDTTVYGKDRFTAPKHAYFHENVLALNKAWATYHEAAIKAAVAAALQNAAHDFSIGHAWAGRPHTDFAAELERRARAVITMGVK